jgi:hypothetical protein
VPDVWGPFEIDEASGYGDWRINGREVMFKVEAIVDDDWRVGLFRADVEMRGKR